MDTLHLHEHLEKLSHFEATARLGKVSMAARSLHLSQAAVSRSVKILEQILQVTLLERRQSGVSLTPEGEHLFSFSKKLLNETEAFEKQLMAGKEQQKTMIKVGTHEALAIYFWPKFLKQFTHRYPQIDVSLISGRIDSLTNGLLDRSYDFLLTVEPFKQQKVLAKVLYSNRLKFYVSEKKIMQFPELNQKSISLNTLNQVTLLTDTASHCKQGLAMTSFLASLGIEMRNIFALNSFEAAIRLAQQGLGVAVLPEITGKNQPNLKLRELKINGLPNNNFGKHHICVSYRKTAAQNRAINILETELFSYTANK